MGLREGCFMTFTNPSSISNKPELFFALFGGVGVRLDVLKEELERNLKNHGYRTVDIRLSRLLPNFSRWSPQQGTGEYARVIHHQNMGNLFRKTLNRGDALALAGIDRIRAERAQISGSRDQPVPAMAYMIHQLKHPDEVDLLRHVYGISFFLLAGHAPRESRQKNLGDIIARDTKNVGKDLYESDALKIIDRDMQEDDDFGQNVRDTYPKADFFCRPGIDSGEWAVAKFIDLLFGHPFRTPSPDEYAMYLASATS